MRDFEKYYTETPIQKLLQDYPAAADFLQNYGLAPLDWEKPLMDALEGKIWPFLEEQGIDLWDLQDLLTDFLQHMAQNQYEIRKLTVCGGVDKSGNPEMESLTVNAGEVISIVGVTGAGKSQLLSDIECAANGDTPSRRKILYDGAVLSDEQRMSSANTMAAQLTQNMNFVVDISVEEFLLTHAYCRGQNDAQELVRRCFDIANELSGEPFQKDTKVTRLSGGQARALMIADAHCISASPVLLIDEIENAGIDRIRAVDLLAGGNKIVLLATHDPLLALYTSRRIVMKNGGIEAVLETSDGEKAQLEYLKREDEKITELRNRIRKGERI